MKHCLVVDKSSVYRLKEDVPLVVPEVNPEAVAGHKNLIATPNCTTIPLVVVLAPLHCAFGLKRVVLASYQSASGAGRDALEEYQYETEFVALKKPVERPDDSPFPGATRGQRDSAGRQVSARWLHHRGTQDDAGDPQNHGPA